MARFARCAQTEGSGPALSRRYHRSRSPWTGTELPGPLRTTASPDRRIGPSSRPWSCARYPRRDAPRFLLPVQRHMIGDLGHDHLRQQARSRSALFDGLRRLGGGFHGAVASVLLAHILDDDHLCRNEFVARAGLFPDEPQVLLAGGTVLFFFRQIMHDALAL